MGRSNKRDVSQAAQAVCDLQIALPNAKVVYSSATGATEVYNLAYADRLGLWGPGTSFANKEEFVNQVEAGGVAAMELVARDMKALGVYISRGLSFAGVEYDRIVHELTQDQREVYDKFCEGWQLTLHNINEALKAICGGDDVDSKTKSAAMSAYWGAHQRAFNQVLCAMQMPSVIIDMEKQLAAGNSCVLQLVNTNEASMERALGKLEEDDDLSMIDMTPRDQLLQMVEKCFPTGALEMYIDAATGKEKFRPVLDSHGNRVVDSEAMELKENLLTELSTLRCPEGPMEIIINHFGYRNVAEVTGRGRRVVRVRENGTERTVIDTRSVAKTIAEAAEFQEGRRRILIFSDAGGTGQSYHASATAKNQQRRYHYLIQAGWVADQAVQGFGRTHRSHQVVAPFYKLVCTNLKGHLRFISSIARRLDQLGALTKGQRDAASTGLFKASDNLESKWARQALNKFYEGLYEGSIDGISLKDFEGQTGLSLTTDDGKLKEKDRPEITKWLNRLLSLKIDMQNAVFEAFSERLDEVVRIAAAAGTLDLGCEVVRADRIEKLSEQIVHVDPSSGAETKLVELKIMKRVKPWTFDEMMEQNLATYRQEIQFFAKNNRSGNVYAFCLAGDKTMPNGSIVPHYTEIGPTTRKSIPQSDIRKHGTDKYGYSIPNWTRLEVGSEQDMATARKLWDKQVSDAPEFTTEQVLMVTGAILPVFSRLPQTNTKVRRLQITDTGERLLGRLIESDEADETLTRLGVTIKNADAPEMMAKRLIAGTHTYTLANGWLLKGVRSNGERRIEIVGPNFNHMEILKQAGCIFERIAYVGHWFIPTGENAAEVIGRVIADKPVADVVRLEKAA